MGMEMEMEIERLVALNVSDEATYQNYRDAMYPILVRYGGRFTVDVRVSEVLTSPAGGPFNRLFTLRFPNEDAMASIFADSDYIAVRDRYFTPSVSGTYPMFKYAVLR